MNSILNIRHLTVQFLHQKGNPQTVINNISLNIKSKQIVSLVGESGSGKSMTAKAIMGLLPDFPKSETTGEIIYQGKNLLTVSKKEMQNIRGSKISMIFQDPMSSLNPRMKIGDQIMEVLEHQKKYSKKEIEQKVKTILEKVGIPDVDRQFHLYPHEFSGGMRQRVMIAIALISNPDLLIADEPTTALDATIQAQILDLMKTLQNDINTSILFITHDLSLAYQYSDYIYVMTNGEIIEENNTNEFFVKPKHKYTKHLIDAVPRLNAKKTPRKISENKLLQVNHLYHSFDYHDIMNNQVLTDLNFDVYEGETLGVIGESGSGKTTLGRIIQGIYPVTYGEILFNGIPIHLFNKKERRQLTKDIQSIFQDPMSSLNPRFRVMDILERPLIIHYPKMKHSERQKQIIELLHDVELDESYLYRYPHELSGGQKQRIGIARAISLKPKLLICDEAVSALDVSIQKEILELLKKIQRNYNITMLFIGHDIAVIQNISDRIIVVKNGKIVEQGDSNSLINNPRHTYTKDLINSIPKFK